jgi:hypothetical protein
VTRSRAHTSADDDESSDEDGESERASERMRPTKMRRLGLFVKRIVITLLPTHPPGVIISSVVLLALRTH